MNGPTVRLGVVLAALLCLAPSIAAAQEWYEFYARGEQALRNNQPQRAAELLQRAIQKRPQPGVAVPTYGTNFEPRYFPYLRLAEAYIRIEGYEDALRVLETSARFAMEPVAERTALEGRARSGLEAKRPPASPIVPPPPAAAPPANPPDSPPVTVPVSPVTQGGAATSSPVTGVPGTSPAPSASPPAPPGSPPATRGSAPSVSPGAQAEVSSARPGLSGVRPASNPPSPQSTETARTGATTLDVTSVPPGADVFIDDEPRGRTDPQTGRLRLTGLGAGRRRVRLSLQGHDDLLQDVELFGESLAFHGVLSVRQVPSAISVPGTPTEPRLLPPRRLVLGLGLGLIVVIPFAFWLRSRTGHPTASGRVPTPAAGAEASSGDTDEGLPIQFGDYWLIRRIGKGGMASVYEAERRGERFALKRPLTGFLNDRTFLERFRRESELGRALHHPNIVRIFDRGEVGPVPYLAMELISGETLHARLERDGRLDVRLATTITAQVAEALDYAHHKGVVHRDLKPSNIMLERSGGVKVMDYGIARSTHLEGVTLTGSFVGTPHYAAPEAVEARTEPRSDLYSLGVVVFQMLTGDLPFRGDNVLAVLHHHRMTPPPAPSSLNYTVSKDLDRIVLRLLSKKPADRPTAEELLNELADYLRRTDAAR